MKSFFAGLGAILGGSCSYFSLWLVLRKVVKNGLIGDKLASRGCLIVWVDLLETSIFNFNTPISKLFFFDTP
jgi:hypothetical protein